jgi:nucleotide-binding universal stress UspA family protein
MAYKTLFSVISDPAQLSELLPQSITLAHKYDAHLEILSLGIDRTQTGYYYAGSNALIVQQTISRAHEAANALAQATEDAMTGETARWSNSTGVAQLADVGRLVGAHTRFCDLAIMAKPYGKDRGVELEALVEAALFDGRLPVLVVPEVIKGGPKILKKVNTVTLAWNESPEALAAVRAALPFLKEAERVRIAVIDPPAHGPERSDPGGRLSQFLSRHGVRAEIDVLSKTLPRVADVILRHATDGDSDLIVMGAYGHSRFREAILGGATRDMLELSPIPVFMAH